MRIGFFYDWDLTLTEEFQQFPIFRAFMDNLVQKYGIKKPEEYLKLSQGTELGVGYMEQMILDSKEVFCGLTNNQMEKEFAKQVQLAEGLPRWFPRMNDFVSKKDCRLEHHVISAGLFPLIRGSLISSYFDSITAGEFLENSDGLWRIKSIIDPFRKVEVFKRICKGKNAHDDIPLADYYIKHCNSFVFGDGQSDIDLFRYLRQRGGIVVAVFELGNRTDFERIKDLMKVDCPEKSFANVVVPRDYSEDSVLSKVIQEKVCEVVDSEKECNVSFELIRNWKLGHIENSELCSFVENHFNSCTSCKNRYFPTVYFS